MTNKPNTSAGPVAVKDYTVLPVGTKLDKGEVQVCSYCRKNGLATKTNDVTFYAHRVGIAKRKVVENNRLIEETEIIDETCPQVLPATPKSTPPK
jgi:hypothetical protein